MMTTTAKGPYHHGPFTFKSTLISTAFFYPPCDEFSVVEGPVAFYVAQANTQGYSYLQD